MRRSTLQVSHEHLDELARVLRVVEELGRAQGHVVSEGLDGLESQARGEREIRRADLLPMRFEIGDRGRSEQLVVLRPN